MARNYKKQKHNSMANYSEDFGHVAYTTTSSTVNITTSLSRVFYADFTAITSTGTVENFRISDPSIGSDGYVMTDNTLEVTRSSEPIYLQSHLDKDMIASQDYFDVPIGVAPVAGTLNEVWWYNETVAGGSPIITMGVVPDNGTGTADEGKLISVGPACPASSTGKSVTSFDTTAIDAGDVITVGTFAGTTTDPEGTMVQVKYTPTLTSGLQLMYRLVGLD